MKLKSTFYGIICSLTFTTVTYSQVGIGTLNPDQSSQLDITATNKGLLIPRVQLTQLSLQTPIIGTAPASLLVYNTQKINDVTPGFYFWSGVKWVRIINKEDIDTFKETITSLVNNGNGNYTYTSENGAITTIDVAEDVKAYQSLTSLSYNSSTQMLTYKDEADNLHDIILSGSRGPQGEIGPQGLPGTNGIDGRNGVDGLAGPQGPQGEIGPQGLPGTNGIDGRNGVDGLAGPQGPQGEIGPEGPQGPAGAPPTTGAGNLSANDYIAITDGSSTTFRNTTINLDLNKVKTDLAKGNLSGTGVLDVVTGDNALLNNATIRINPGRSGEILTTTTAGTVLWQPPVKTLAIKKITVSQSINIITDEVVLIDASASGSSKIFLTLPFSGAVPFLIGKVFTVKRIDSNRAATVEILAGTNAIDETQSSIDLNPKESYQFIIESVAPFYKYQIIAKF